ncbi:hypothetical protein HPULCUR_007478 [Helicostylum pulchrum]|uniref:Uncharacterized protein n=1 Tax=Helicostylum pulchrum TaxID=562976 RepID=A0ABP9Y4U8_9FUNG
MLSLDDIKVKSNLKVDLRILQDEPVQRRDQEVENSVFEASKSCPSVQKFQSDHCKLMIECKTIIDMYIDKGFDVDNVDCIQICGLEILISNVRLSASGLYTGNELFYGSITNSLSQLEKMIDIALNLLDFTEEVVKLKSNYQEERDIMRQNNKNVKGYKYNRALDKTPDNVSKKDRTRRTWVAFRDSRSSPAPFTSLTDL